MKRVAALGLLAVGCLLFIGACPAEELRVKIDVSGVDRLVTACIQDPPLTPFAECHLPALPSAPIDAVTVALKAFLISQDFEIKDESACAAVGYVVENGTVDRVALVQKLNVALDGALAQGMTFDDFEDPDEAILIFAFYVDDTQTCTPDKLFSCASLSNAFGDDFNIDCAGCNGNHPIGALRCPDGPTDVCPAATCFFESCAALLGADVSDACF